MKFAASLKSLVMLAATSLLVACGGGGGSDSNSGFTPAGLSLTTSSANISLNARSLTTITATLRTANNTPVADGATITATVNGAGLGNLSSGNGSNGNTASANTVGGVVSFYFQTGGTPGTGSITFSAADPSTTSRTVTRTVNVTVGSGPGNDPRLTIQPTRTEIPVNTDGVPFFIGSPFIAEVLVNVRSASGQPITDEVDGDQAVQFAITPVTLGAVSVLDNPETDDVNELTTPWGSIFTGVASGTARAFVWSDVTPGVITLRASFQDPDTGQNVEAIHEFSITSNIPPLPGNVSVSAPSAPIYASNSGGPSSGTISIGVTDGAGSPVPDPVQGSSAFNNLRLEVLSADGSGDAVLSGTSAAGNLQEGASIVIRTTNGAANALVRSGLETGAYIIRATSDRADNNVDNGITSPVIGERTLVISDGILFSIKLVSPDLDAVLANRVDAGVDVDGEPIPSPLDGTYSLVVSVIATDRQGNPVLPGTPIEFGLVDEPLVGFPEEGSGVFVLSGFDGDPQESGTLFTADSGDFAVDPINGPNESAGPGDTLLVFGQEVPGNRDLESARTVAQVNSETSLTVDQPFNANDDSGNSVDFGEVLPYIVGRATVGNIGATATTNSLGVATTTMNYPVSILGKAVAMWARGAANVPNGQKLVSDVDTAVFPGIAPATLIASPSTIPGNTTAYVTVCLIDANSSPLQGVFIGFGFSLESGSGSVDGQGGGGTLANATGASGCALAEVTTTGLTQDGEDQVIFSLPGVEPAAVDITVSDELILQASPTAILGNGTFTINLRLIDGSGNPVENAAISGTCEGSGETAIVNISRQPDLTDADGETSATIIASQMDQPDGGAEWTCTFALAGGEPSADVIIKGRDSCAIGLGASPPAPIEDCEDETDPEEEFELELTLVDGGGDGVGTDGGGGATVAGSMVCSVANESSETCSSPFPEGTVANLQVTPAFPADPDTVVTVSGSCQIIGSDEGIYSVRSSPINSDISCEINIRRP